MKAALIGVFWLVVGMAALEGTTRYLDLGGSRESPRYLEISRSFDGLQQLIKDKYQGGLKYYDFQLYAVAPFSTPSITITDYWSARRTPASLPRREADTIVWTFGGSTMQNFETTDELSIANTIAKSLKAAGMKARVENFGVGSFYSSLEFVQFTRRLTQVPAIERPKIAVFYDGFNDANHSYLFGAGNMQGDLAAKMAMLVEGRSGQLVIYSASAWLAKHSRAWAAAVHNNLQKMLFKGSPPDTSDENLGRAVDTYVQNVSMAQAVCSAQGIRCYFVLQPLVVTKSPLMAIERQVLAELGEAQVRFIRGFYAQVPRILAGKANFIDASRILDGHDKDDFYDLGHTGALTSPVIGEAVAKLLIQRLGASDSGK